MLVAPKFAKKINPRVIRELSEMPVPWGPLGLVTYKRTYARQLNGRLEDWHETIERCCNGLLEIGAVFSEEQIADLAYYMHQLKGSPAGRPLWQLGTETVRRIGGDSLNNCLAGDTEIITDQGVIKIKDVVGKRVKVRTLSDNGPLWVDTVFRSYGVQPLMEVTFHDGFKVRVTPNHRWYALRSHRESTLYGKCRVITTLQFTERKWNYLPLCFGELPNTQCEEYREGFAHGVVYGDGNKSYYGETEVRLFGSKRELLPHLTSYGVEGHFTYQGERCPAVRRMPCHWKELPENPSRSYALGFMMGLISTDGTVTEGILLPNCRRYALESIQVIARHAGLRVFGIKLASLISPFDGSEKPQWRISISTFNLHASMFPRKDQAARFTQSADPKTHTVKSLVNLGIEEEVYCCQVPVWQNFALANGVITGNCWVCPVNHPIDPFTFTFNELMLGGGVGFNIEPEYVYEIPPVRFSPAVEATPSFDCDFIVTDNREGWVELLQRVLSAFFIDGKPLRYCTRSLRVKGSPIRGFGGVASGPEPLTQGIDQIVRILRSRHGRKLTPTNCLDILNIIAKTVVSGNVRRSAQIAIGSYQDQEYLEAKDWSRKVIPPWRQNSNNSINCSDTVLLPESFWRSYQPGCGESYGLVNLDLARVYGRLVDGEGYRPDPGVIGTNPCSEIFLEPYEACNLADIFLPNIDDVQEFGKAASLLLRAAKAIGGLTYWHPRSNEVIHRNRRIGIGVTGYIGSRFQDDADTFNAVYSHLEDADVKLSKEMNCSPSNKLTTLKPAGTLSLLAGVKPGIHEDYAPFWVRRITLASNSPLVEPIRAHGYHVAPKINIDGSLDYGTLIAEFPCKSKTGTSAKDLTPIQQLETQRFLQTYWSDNSISQTIYYRPEQLPDIQSWLREHYADEVKATSFLLHSEHGFVQAPYEEITEAQYHELKHRCRPIENLLIEGNVEIDESTECGTGGCPVR